MGRIIDLSPVQNQKSDRRSALAKSQLGMAVGTASYRLVKDLLFDFIEKAGHVCFRCGEPMSRADFSIEHKEPWLHSEDPLNLFFDKENIAYSHLSCNSAAGRKKLVECGIISGYDRGCRCDRCKAAKKEFRARYYTADQRRKKYERNGT